MSQMFGLIPYAATKALKSPDPAAPVPTTAPAAPVIAPVPALATGPAPGPATVGYTPDDPRSRLGAMQRAGSANTILTAPAGATKLGAG